MARPTFSSTTTGRRRPSSALRRGLMGALAGALLVPLAAIVCLLVPASRASGSTQASSIALLSETPWVRTTAGMHLQVAVRSDLSPSRLGLVATLYSQVTERGYFEETLSGDLQDFTVLSSSPVIPLTTKGVLGPGGVATLDLPVAPPAVPGKPPRAPRNGTVLDLPCSGACAGVYPLQVSLEDRETYTPLDSFMTYLVLLPRQVASPLRFSLVLPVGGTPALSSSGQPVPPPADEVELELLDSSLATHPSVPVTVALYPQLATALEEKAVARVKARGAARAAPGSAAAAAALTALRRLVALPNVQMTEETYARVDLSAMALSGLAGEAARQFSTGRAALKAVGANLVGSAYASSMPVGPHGLSLVKSAGLDQVVVPSDSVSPPAASWVYPVWAPFFVRRGHGKHEEVDASDLALEQHLESSSDPVLRADQLLADLAVLYFVEQPPGNRGVSLLAPFGWRPTRSFLETLLSGLKGSLVVRPVTLSGLFRQVPAGSGEIPYGAPISPLLYRSVVDNDLTRSDLFPPSTVVALREARATLRALGLTLSDADGALDGPEHTVLVGESAGVRRSRRLLYFAAPSSLRARLADLVSLPRKRTITITSLSARIPVSISSKAPTPLDVDLRLSACPFTSPDCHGGISVRPSHPFHLRLAPGNKTLEVRVSARSSGDFYLYLELTSPGGGILLAESRILIRSTAISGVAIVLTAVAGAFLLVWWTRSALLRRRGKHARRVRVADDDAVPAAR